MIEFHVFSLLGSAQRSGRGREETRLCLNIHNTMIRYFMLRKIKWYFTYWYLKWKQVKSLKIVNLQFAAIYSPVNCQIFLNLFFNISHGIVVLTVPALPPMHCNQCCELQERFFMQGCCKLRPKYQAIVLSIHCIHRHLPASARELGAVGRELPRSDQRLGFLLNTG